MVSYGNKYPRHNARPHVVEQSGQCARALRLNSHGRHVSVYFPDYPSLVLAFRVVELDCKLQLAARPSGRQPAVD